MTRILLSYPRRRPVITAGVLLTVAGALMGGPLSPLQPSMAFAQEYHQNPLPHETPPVGPLTPGTADLMNRLRDLGLAPEQEGMDPQGLYAPEDETGGLLDALRAKEAAEAEAEDDADDPGEPLLTLPRWATPAFREELRVIVRELARYARTRDPNFVILARDGAPLAVRSEREAILDAARSAQVGLGVVDPESPAAGVGEISSGFIGAIDGLVLDGQFCGEPALDAESLATLGSLDVALLSIDHCLHPEDVAEARRRADEVGVVLMVDTRDTGRLDVVPDARPPGENADTISDPRQVRTALMLDHGGGFGDVSMLIGALRSTNHDMVIINPFAIGGRALTAQQVAELRYKRLGARRLVIATFDITQAHEDQYYWQPPWRLGKPRWLSATVRDGAGSYFTEYWDPAWKKHLGEHFVGLMDLGFDGVLLEGLDVVNRWEAITPVKK